MSPRRPDPPARPPSGWLDRIDWSIAARGASRGLTAVVIVSLIGPLASRLHPVAGLVWLILGLLGAFAIAAWQSGPASSPPLTGAASSFFGYTLSVPLIYLVQHHVAWRYVAMWAVIALITGAVVGHYVGARHVPEPPPRRPRR